MNAKCKIIILPKRGGIYGRRRIKSKVKNVVGHVTDFVYICGYCPFGRRYDAHENK